MDQWVQIVLTIVGSGISSYIGMTIKIVRLEERVRAINEEVGTRDSGMRKHVHDMADTVQTLVLKVANLERRIEERES